MKAIRWLLLAIGFAPVGGVAAQTAGLCLDVQDMGSWSPLDLASTPVSLRVPPPADDEYDYDFPDRIQLGSELVRLGNWSKLIIPSGSQQTPHSWRFWRVSGDTLLILLGDGFGSIQARLTRQPPGWRGTLRTDSDNIGTLLYERMIGLKESPCDSAPPVSDSEDPPLPRVVQLEQGASLELGELVPGSVAVEPRRRAR
jgi:hypothetical protein